MPVRTMTNRATYLASIAAGKKPGENGYVETDFAYQGHLAGIAHHATCKRGNHLLRVKEATRGGCVGDGALEPTCDEDYDQEYVRHADCVHPDPTVEKYDAPGGWHGVCKRVDPLYMELSHVGVVVDANGEENGRDDSDFYALVWVPKGPVGEGKLERCYFASTRGWTYPNNAWVDATPEVLAAVKAAREAAQEEAARAREAAYLAQQAKQEEARKFANVWHAHKGKQARVKTGKQKGHVGTLFWIGWSSTGETLRAGVKDDKGVVAWASVKAIELL